MCDAFLVQTQDNNRKLLFAQSYLSHVVPIAEISTTTAEREFFSDCLHSKFLIPAVLPLQPNKFIMVPYLSLGHPNCCSLLPISHVVPLFFLSLSHYGIFLKCVYVFTAVILEKSDSQMWNPILKWVICSLSRKTDTFHIPTFHYNLDQMTDLFECVNVQYVEKLQQLLMGYAR